MKKRVEDDFIQIIPEKGDSVSVTIWRKTCEHDEEYSDKISREYLIENMELVNIEICKKELEANKHE